MSGGQQQLVSIMAGAGGRAGNSVPRRTFSALDYEMTLFIARTSCSAFSWSSDDDGAGFADLEEAVYLSDRNLLLSRHPARAVEFVHYDAAGPHAADDVGGRFSSAPRAHCLEISSAQVRKGLKKPLKTPADIAAVCRVGVLLRSALTVLARVVDPVFAVTDLDVPRDVGRDGPAASSALIPQDGRARSTRRRSPP